MQASCALSDQTIESGGPMDIMRPVSATQPSPTVGALALCLFLCMALLAPAAAGAAPDNSLACELVSNSAVKKALGVSHIDRASSATSPTAPAPNDHTVDGADQSVCEVFGFDHKPSKTVLKQLSNARKPVPPSVGTVVITTEVRDEEPNGEGPSWDPTETTLQWATALRLDRKALGGAVFESPGLGSFLHRSAWIGNRDRTAGFYEVGDGGDASAIVVINVAASKGATKAFAMIAKKVVPPFTEIVLTP